MTLTTQRRGRLVAFAAVALALATVATQAPAKAGTNLAPNASFERSIVEPPAPVPPYTNPQPALPEGWAFEGAAGLFDHSQNGSHSGRRMAAISIPASGKRTYCVDPAVPCVDDPSTGIKEGPGNQYAAIAPHWRTAEAIPVSAGTRYTLSSWVWLSLATQGEGAVMRIRWVDALGTPIGISTVRRFINTNNAVDTGWVFQSGSAVAPSGAAGAILMLGTTTDAWISQIRFDDVYFGL